MTITAEAETEAVEIPKSLELLLGGQMPCDTAGCKVIFGHPVELDSEYAAPLRQQLQQVAAAEHGWKQTTASLFVCPDCAAGPLGLVVVEDPHWNPLPKTQPRPPVMHGDNVSTIAIPAIRVADLRTPPAGVHPYERTSA
jgi:hypothetical protein